MIHLIVKPGEVIQWDEFCETHPAYSIALDGYVRGAPRFQDAKEGGPRQNFNHHEDVDRLGTRCTAAQVHYAIKNGLFECFDEQGIPKANLYVNDPDQDVSLAVWLLRNHERIRGERSEPLINMLVNLADRLDVTGGCYPMDPNDRALRQYDWVFEPYTAARMAGRLPQLSPKEVEGVIEAVGRRIDEYTLGKGKELPVDTRYEIIGGGQDWKLVKETGSRARLKMMKDGIHAFASVLNQRADGKWTYTLARQSVYIPFPVDGLYDYLNALEGMTSPSGWGGGNTIGGSPRKFGSSLDPAKLERAINEYIAEQHAHA
ncbi:hypothetical protein J4219_05900 [Candidatus Woesearchaeota archaeon]|nr:hypothetical protein [Candidatus Woesearchaeota archaeon]